MSTVPHLPTLRKGKAYDSLTKVEVKNHRTGEVMAEVSQVNAGIIRRDLSRIDEARAALKKFTVAAPCPSEIAGTLRRRKSTSPPSRSPAACHTSW